MTRRSLVLSCAIAAAVLACRSNDTPAPTATQSGTAATATQTTTPAPAVTTQAPVQTASAPQAAQQPGDEAPRITIPDTKAALAAGNALIVDVRTDAQWEEGHAKGAIHIPESELASRLSEMPRNRTIIAYCS